MKIKNIKNIIFSKTPLLSHFEQPGQFQIYPCDFPDAPRSDKGADFPLVIEYWIDEEENPAVTDEEIEDIKNFISPITNQTNKLNKLTRLLSAVTNHRIFNYAETELKWGIGLPGKLGDKEKEELNKESSKLIFPLYYYPNMSKDLQSDGFSKQRHPDSVLIKHTFYYYYDPLDDKRKTIFFPHSIHTTLDKYFKLDAKSKKVVDAVTHLICNGIDIKFRMKSLSFLSFVSAIETLVNYEYKDMKDSIEFECHDCQTIKSSPVKCQKCGRPIWGVKAKFKTFLRTYVANSPNSVKKFNRIYNLRSEIVHNGLLLLGDETTSWEKSEKADSQWMIHIETMQLARLALANWLLMGPGKTPVTD